MTITSVTDLKRRFVLVLEASDWSKIGGYLSFLTGLGSIEILPASISETGIARGGCVNLQPDTPFQPR